MENRKTQKLTPNQAYIKAMVYCAYQERSHREIRAKLFSYGLYADDVEDLISKLITENFINEERYAKLYVGGKFRIKKWGKNKIKASLKAEGISDYCIKKGMAEIDENDYLKTIKKLWDEKYRSDKTSNKLLKKQKIVRYLISKGYESDLIFDIANSYML
jgi:regulatory protein